MPTFDTSDFIIPPVGKPRGIFTLTTCILFDIDSLICIDFLLTGINFIEPLKILELFTIKNCSFYKTIIAIILHLKLI